MNKDNLNKLNALSFWKALNIFSEGLYLDSKYIKIEYDDTNKMIKYNYYNYLLSK